MGQGRAANRKDKKPPEPNIPIAVQRNQIHNNRNNTRKKVNIHGKQMQSITHRLKKAKTHGTSPGKLFQNRNIPGNYAYNYGMH